MANNRRVNQKAIVRLLRDPESYGFVLKVDDFEGFDTCHRCKKKLTFPAYYCKDSRMIFCEECEKEKNQIKGFSVIGNLRGSVEERVCGNIDIEHSHLRINEMVLIDGTIE